MAKHTGGLMKMKKKRVISPEGRARMSEAAKKRWAKMKEEEAQTAPTPTGPVVEPIISATTTTSSGGPSAIVDNAVGVIIEGIVRSALQRAATEAPRSMNYCTHCGSAFTVVSAEALLSKLNEGG